MNENEKEQEKKIAPEEKQEIENFEDQSPLLNEDVIQRKNDIVLEAQPVNNPPVTEEKEVKPITKFGKPTINAAAPAAKEEKEENSQEESAKDPLPTMTGTSNGYTWESKAETKGEENKEVKPEGEQEKIHEETKDDLPKMKGEDLPNQEQGQTLQGIQKKAGQTTAKWSWTLFENATPKLQSFLTELDEGEIRKHVLDDLLPAQAIEFAKDYNESLEEELRIKDWEKELIYPPLEEMLEQAGMNASMSPGARFGLGLTVVLGARAMQTKKYRAERDELVEKLMKSYAKSKEAGEADNASDTDKK